MLQSLKEFAEDERFDLPPTLYSRRPIRYLIDLDLNGKLRSPIPVDTSNTTCRKNGRGIQVMAPSLSRSKGIRPLLLADNAEYTLGVRREQSDSMRVRAMHREYIKLVEQCASETRLPSVAAVSSFLISGTAGLDLRDDFDPGGTITFRVGGKFPIDSSEVQKFWAGVGASSGGRLLQCLICGDMEPVLSRLPKKVKGIPRGRPAGAAIISANTSVLESYGLRNSEIAPTCADCGDKFTESANFLLSDEKSHLQFPNCKVIFWSRKPTQFDWERLLGSPHDVDIQTQMRSLWSNECQDRLNDNALYCAVLSANGGRAVLRDWIETTVSEAKQNLRAWFRRQSIVTRQGDAPRPLGIQSLAAATVREPGDTPSSVTAALVRSAFVGTLLPIGLLYQAVRRNRVEQRVTRSRAALIKLTLGANGKWSYVNGHMVELDTTNQDPAYLCGRLLYWLEHAHRAAVPNIRITIIDRYFAIASTSPAEVFPLLLRRTRQHLSSLKRIEVAARRAIEGHISGTLDGLPEFPRTSHWSSRACLRLVTTISEHECTGG